MSLPRVGIIGTGWFGCALQTAWMPLIGKTISGIDIWKFPKDRPKIDPEILVLAIPSTAKNGEKLAILDYIESFPRASIIVTSKGRKALKIFQKHISPADKWRVFSLSGPNMADQIGHTPTATKIAGNSLQTAEYLAQTLSSNLIDVEASEAIEVVQRGGMLKNFLVFELGKLWGSLSSPEEKVEAVLLAIHAGFESVNIRAPGEEDRAEFLGISGLGDILLCLDIFPHTDGSRNFRAGKSIALGKNNEKDVLKEFQTLEGLVISKKVYSGRPSRSFSGPKMVLFCDMIQGKKIPLFNKSQFPELPELMHSVWSKFLQIATEKKFQSNTHSWVACELLMEVSSANLVSLSRWESAEPFVRSLVEALLLSPPKKSSLSPELTLKIWTRLVSNLPFLKHSSTGPRLKHLLPISSRHSTQGFFGWKWALNLSSINRSAHKRRVRKDNRRNGK